MNRTWSFIHEETGGFTGQRFTGPERALADNTPAGCKAVEGVMEIDRFDDAELKRARTLDQIEALELKQLRSLTELVLALTEISRDPSVKAARDALAQRKQQIDELAVAGRIRSL